MLSVVPSERKKWETNSVPQSEVTWEGTPCLEKMCRRNSCASWGDVMVSYVGTKMACLDSRSMTTRMAVKPEEEGSCSIKSMEMESHGLSGIGSCLSSP